jgi:hypothetical protein
MIWRVADLNAGQTSNGNFESAMPAPDAAGNGRAGSAGAAGARGDSKAPARKRATPASATPAGSTSSRDPVHDEAMRVKAELDRSNAILKRLLRELEDRGPNGPGVPQIWDSVRQAATTSDQLIQRLDRLRADLARRT